MSRRTGVLSAQSYVSFKEVNSSSITTVMMAMTAVASALRTNAFNKSVLRKCLNTGGFHPFEVVLDVFGMLLFFFTILSKKVPMGTRVSVFSNAPNTLMYVAKKKNSYVQIEADLHGLVPKLELVWCSNHWHSSKPKDKDMVWRLLLRKVARRIKKDLNISPNLPIQRVVYKRDRMFFLENGFEIMGSTKYWCRVGVTVSNLL